MARAIHIAVNLLLIVVMTMQPGLVYGRGQHCSVGTHTGMTCGSCGCCEVSPDATSCPCCSPKRASRESGCCGDHHDQQHAASPAGDTIAKGKLQNGAVSDSVIQSSHEDDLPVQATELAANCCCTTAPGPVDAPVHRSSSSELRDVLTLSVAGTGGVEATNRRLLPETVRLACLPAEAHFSQIAFCVWRL